ncbi:MAG TPA: hypothetical protein VKV06_15845 [Acidimicrobiales bacterium]|nr:hypothetical protein [Acidimicrobiales bacterium]
MHPVSIRFQDAAVAKQLQAEAAARRKSTSSLAEELIDEGLRTRRHPLIGFRDGAAGRRAYVGGGPDVWEVIGDLLGGDVPPAQRVQRAVELFGLQRVQVQAALSYYAEYTDEINRLVEANNRAATLAELLWRRGQELLST